MRRRRPSEVRAGRNTVLDTGNVYYSSMKTRFCHFSSSFSTAVRNKCVFPPVMITMCGKKHKQQINVKFFVKLEKI